MTILLLVLIPAIAPAQTRTLSAPTSSDVLKLDTFKVSGASEAASTELTDVYAAQDIEDSGAFDLGEFIGQLPDSPVGTEQLVLIDGQPTYMDISKLMPEMVASIEVSNYGALPQYAAYANGRVINIRLKSNYRGESLSLETRGAFAGGGLQGEVRFSGGVTRNKLRFIYSVGYKRQESLHASDRAFSRNQDHTSLGGQDLRLLWGDTAVVQAVSGFLPGVLDANGQPTAVALAPEDQDGQGLVPGDFLPPQVFPPATAATAAGQRRFNTAAYRTLITPSEERNATFNLSRPFGKQIEAALSGSVNDRASPRDLAPPVTAASTDTLVPAAYNPFGQDVQVGLVHAGFGPVRQRDEGTGVQLGLHLNGRWADTWRWSAGLGTRWNRSTQHVTDLDRDKFSAALAAVDAARRFNPFGDDPAGAALYPALAIERSSESRNAATRLDLSAQGDLLTLPGGPGRLMVRGDYNDQVRIRTYDNPAGPAVADTRRHDNSQGVNTSFSLPWVGQANARPGVRRLETNLAAGYSARSSSEGGTHNGRFGVMWSPHKAINLRANYAVTRRAPSRFVADAQSLTGETLIDPRRFPTTTADVEIVEHDFDGAVRARSEMLVLGASIEPPVLPGFEFSFNYDRQQQDDLTSSAFKPQGLIYNELTFPGRVERAASTADDLLLGQPGRIVRIDTTPTDQAAQAASGLALSLRYRRKSEQLGRVQWTMSVRRPLTRRYEVVPGVPFVFESDNDLNPPDWNLRTQLAWNRGGWRVSANFRFVDEVVSGGLVQPATRQLNLQAGYRFSRAVWGRWGRGMQVAVGLGDVLEGAPPFADTINGYRSGSPLGRTWSLTMRVPLLASAKERVEEED